MSYLPPRVIDDTIFPTANNPYKDLAVHASLLIELWEKQYPLITYYMLDLDIEKASSDLSGKRPHTVVDDLYGESIPTSDQVSNTWQQPHERSPEGDELDATIHNKYKEPVEINAKIEVVRKDRTLREMGISDERDLEFDIPTPLLDKKGITVKIGDLIEWDGERFEVTEVSRTEMFRWGNTNYYMHLSIYANREELGS